MVGVSNRRLVLAASLALIVLAPMMTGCLTLINLLFPAPPPLGLAPTISVADAKAMFDQMAGDPNLVFLDVRLPAEYNAEHVQGAANLCILCASNFKKDLEALDKTLTYIVYADDTATDDRSTRATDAMVEINFQDVHNMAEGFAAWKTAGHPTE